MASLDIFGPDARLFAHLQFSDLGKVGQSRVTLEGPEPAIERLKAAYPPGVYRIVAVDADGRTMTSRATLSYDLLTPPKITFPINGAKAVIRDGLVLRWQPVAGAARIHFEIEAEKDAPAGSVPKPQFSIDLPGTATQLSIPEGWLASGVDYIFDVKAMSANGNRTVTDAVFTTQ